MAVEPRISENSRVIGISTPVNWRLRRSVMHLVQRAGLPEDCRNPACLKTRPPSPANGAAHNLQRGGDGIRLNIRRCLASQGLSPVSTARASSVNSSAAIYPHRLILEAAGKRRVGSRSRGPAVDHRDTGASTSYTRMLRRTVRRIWLRTPLASWTPTASRGRRPGVSRSAG
jgi:hypothetical protein